MQEEKRNVYAKGGTRAVLYPGRRDDHRLQVGEAMNVKQIGAFQPECS